MTCEIKALVMMVLIIETLEMGDMI